MGVHSVIKERSGGWVMGIGIMRMWPRNWGWQLNNYVLDLAVHVGMRTITWLNIGWSDKVDLAPDGTTDICIVVMATGRVVVSGTVVWRISETYMSGTVMDCPWYPGIGTHLKISLIPRLSRR